MQAKNVRRLASATFVGLLAISLGCSSSKTSGGGGTHADINQTLRDNFQAPTTGPVLIAAYQPWFGRQGHINVGYNSQDPVVLEKQITHAKSLGIEAFVVNWYGPRHNFEDRAYATLQQKSSENNFKTAVMYDEDTDDPENATQIVIKDLKYAYDRYMSHDAVNRDAYLRFNGHPLIFIFPKGSFTHWDEVVEQVHSWDGEPLIIYKDIPPRYTRAFDGYYAWVNPGRQGWQRIGSAWGEDYLSNFYLRVRNNFPNKLAVGAAWPGFNDSKASWSRNRKMDARCGKTFDDSLRLFRRYYTPDHPLPFLMIVTWNDYEEGTAIEPGIATCNGQAPRPTAGE
jgi:hypothetical protein